MFERISDGRTDLVFEALAQGHPATMQDSGGVSLIQWCAYYGDVSAVRYLLTKGETPAALGTNFDLNGACFHGHWQLCQFLIELGADVNFPLPETGESPLHSAASKANRPGYVHVVRILLAAGADPNAKTFEGAETGAFMRDARTKGETPLHRAAAFGSEEMIRLLLDGGARKEAKDMGGDTPLSWASWHQRPTSILKLLCHGDYSVGGPNHFGDHGAGWSGMDAHLLGRPHL